MLFRKRKQKNLEIADKKKRTQKKHFFIKKIISLEDDEAEILKVKLEEKEGQSENQKEIEDDSCSVPESRSSDCFEVEVDEELSGHDLSFKETFVPQERHDG